MTATPGRLREVVVVGGSVGGFRTAAALRRRGYDGTIRVLSGESVAHYYRPALTKSLLAGDQTEDQVALPGADDVDVWTAARAVGLDAAAKRVLVQRDGERVELGYDGLVIATGLVPRRPFAPLAGVHHVREIDDTRRLRHDLATGPRVVVVGGGLIGTEVAATARRLGLDVTVVEPEPTLLRPVLGPVAGALVTDLHRGHGVRVLTGVGVRGLRGADRVESVELTTGESLPADVVVVAVGNTPATDWLAGSGVAVDDGVLTSPNLAVLGADRAVAVGDVARVAAPGEHRAPRNEHWDNAVRQADAAARTLLEGAAAPAYAAHTTFWSHQFDLQVHVMGHPGPDDELRVQEGSLDELEGVATYHRGDGRVSAVLALGRPARLRAYKPLLDGAPAPTPARA